MIIALTLAPNETADKLMDETKPDRVAVTFCEAVEHCLEAATASSAVPVSQPDVTQAAAQTGSLICSSSSSR